MLLGSGTVRCAGAPVAFRRWHRSAQAGSGKLDFFCKLGIEGLPANAWEWSAVSQLINNLQGQLVEILPQVDRWQMEVTAWMRNPSSISKIYDLEVPEPVGLPNSFEPELPLTPPPPAPPTERLTLIHPLTIHVLDVVDRTVPFMEFRQDYEPDEEEDLARRHDYSRFCFRGRVDGTGMGSTPRSGAHPFGGPGGFGMAGDWGGRRANGLLAPAGGVPPPLRTSTRTMTATDYSSSASAARPKARSAGQSTTALNMEHSSPCPLASTVVGSATFLQTPVQALSSSILAPSRGAPAAAGSAAMILAMAAPATSNRALSSNKLVPSGCASTAVGSTAYGDTPAGQGASGVTAVGSAACGPTPPSGWVTLLLLESPRRLSFSPNIGARDALIHDEEELSGRCSSQLAFHPSMVDEEPIPPEAGDRPEGLKTLVVQQRDEGSSVSCKSPVRTPFAVPISPSKLLPPLAPKHKEEQVLGPKTAEATLLEGLGATPKASILGPMPAASAPVHRRKIIPPNFTPRRSARLNKNNAGMNKGPYHRAQTVLLRRLGVIEAEEQVSKEALEEFLKLFDKPLAPHHIKAIVALFDPDGVDFDEPAYEGFSAFQLPEVVDPCGS